MDSIGKIKPYMFSFFFFEKKKRGQASLSRLGLFLPTFFLEVGRGLEIWSGHFNFLIFLFFFVLFFIFGVQKIGEFFFYGDYYLRY